MSDDLLVAGISETAWLMPANMTYEQWEAIGTTLQQLDLSTPMWLGDWLNQGEARFGETYAAAIKLTGHKLDRLAQYKWVYAHVPPENRFPGLTHTHYRIVAKLPVEKQLYWLERAYNEDIATAELDALVNPKQDSRRKSISKDSTPQQAAAYLQDNFDPMWLSELLEELRTINT